MIATPAFAGDEPALPPSWLPPFMTAAVPGPEVDYYAPRPVPAFQADFAMRYWFASAKTGKSLYADPDGMVSRLTYSGMMANSGEIYGRIAVSNGWFLKGYLGIGALSNGTLQDEDFPPLTVPYSSTLSSQRNGYLDYASADVGYNFLRGGDFSLGAFVGYHYFNQVVNAYDCAQTAGNPNICQPDPIGYEVITQNNRWQSARLGLTGSVLFAERFTLSAEGAWLPYVRLNGTDAHWLRIMTGEFSGPIPEDGAGQGYQLEALLSYKVMQNASVGVGARYWHMQTNGSSHFEDVTLFGMPQPVDWKTDIYGVFVQGSLKFGPYPMN